VVGGWAVTTTEEESLPSSQDAPHSSDPDRTGRRMPRRTVAALAGLLLLVTASAGAGALLRPWRQLSSQVPLDTPPAAEVSASAPAAAHWLSTGIVPGTGTPSEPMIRRALLDLHLLTTSQGAATAGRSRMWRYVWPRDAAFVAAAFARTGHRDDALAVLEYLQRMPFGSQGFEARYLPDGSGAVPDTRGPELDGAGWVLWASGQLAAAEPDPAARRAIVTRLAPMIERCSAFTLRVTRQGRVLPPASKDYWEVPEQTVTLGVAAPLLAGLQASMRLHLALADTAAAETDAVAADRLAATIRARFGPGYPRRPGGDRRDAAIAFLLPPFVEGTPDPALLGAWRAVQIEAARPAGGLAPGAGWKDDGVSWTPETALFALTAAATGDRPTAQRWLTWLAAHRTAQGALPEKVLADGSPAAVAPLAWTAASVVLTAVVLDATAPESARSRPPTPDAVVPAPASPPNSGPVTEGTQTPPEIPSPGR